MPGSSEELPFWYESRRFTKPRLRQILRMGPTWPTSLSRDGYLVLNMHDHAKETSMIVPIQGSSRVDNVLYSVQALRSLRASAIHYSPSTVSLMLERLVDKGEILELHTAKVCRSKRSK